MKAMLEFSLPEEQEEFHTASGAGATMSVVEDVLLYIRNRLKYEDLSADVAEALGEVRTRLLEAVR